LQQQHILLLDWIAHGIFGRKQTEGRV